MKLKQLQNLFNVILNANSIVQYVVQIKNGINACQCECKNYCTCKKDYSWNPSTCICENNKYLYKVFLILQWSIVMKL